MKNIWLKSVITTGMVVIIAIGAFAAGDKHQHKNYDMKAIMENIRAEQAAVNQNLIKLNQQQEKVKALGKQCREAKGESAVHKQYKQAKADLKDYKAQLKTGDKKLMKAHQEHVKAHKSEVRAERDVLEKAQRQLDRDKARGKVSTLNQAEKVMDSRALVRASFNGLERARLGRDKDRWVINKEYKDGGAKSSLELSWVNGNNVNASAQK